MPSQETKLDLDISSLVPVLADEGLPEKQAKRVKELVIGRADVLKRRGRSEVQIDDLTRLIDDILGLRKNKLRCFVILRARDALESLIDPS